MKVEPKTRIAASRAARAYRSQAPAAAPAAGGPADLASVMGIPEAEFTPKVREAMQALMQEVEALRVELAETKAQLEAVEKDADQDQLLPVLNRRAFVREMGRAMAGAARYGTQASLLYFDLDGFKQVNDRFGHAAGDAVLRHFATVLATEVRDSDIVGRLGGDEFGVVLAHAGELAAHRKAGRLTERLAAEPAQWQGFGIPAGFSYGVVELRPGEDVAAALGHADAAMYAQKRQALSARR